jgi:hypothetical protein
MYIHDLPRFIFELPRVSRSAGGGGGGSGGSGGAFFVFDFVRAALQQSHTQWHTYKMTHIQCHTQCHTYMMIIER